MDYSRRLYNTKYYAANKEKILAKIKINEHKCELCDYTTNYKFNLKQHFNANHKKKLEIKYTMESYGWNKSI